MKQIFPQQGDNFTLLLFFPPFVERIGNQQHPAWPKSSSQATDCLSQLHPSVQQRPAQKAVAEDHVKAGPRMLRHADILAIKAYHSTPPTMQKRFDPLPEQSPPDGVIRSDTESGGHQFERLQGRAVNSGRIC